jgi:homoaconitase/3-isopropylmalate dehydratase large subunit
MVRPADGVTSAVAVALKRQQVVPEGVLLHEITSAQAFEGLRQSGRPIWRNSASLAGLRSQRPDHESQKRHRRSGIWQVNIYWS